MASRVRIGLAAVAVAAACALPSSGQELRLPKVDVEHDPSADFSRFKTYAWKPDQQEASERSTHVNLTWHTERGLEKKGLAKVAPADADVLVRYYVLSVDKSVRGLPSQAEGPAGDVRTNVNFDRVTSGTLVLELSARGAEGFVWRASTPFVVSDRRRIEQDIKTTVGRLLAKYPPPPAAP